MSYDDQIKNNKTEKQKDRRTKRKDVKRGDGGVWEGAASSRFFDLFNSMIFDLKRSVDPRRSFDPVLHSSIDDRCSLFSVILVFVCHYLSLSLSFSMYFLSLL